MPHQRTVVRHRLALCLRSHERKSEREPSGLPLGRCTACDQNEEQSEPQPTFISLSGLSQFFLRAPVAIRLLSGCYPVAITSP